MIAQELREKYLKFFESKGHTIIPSASLIPEGTDPSALFITAGMHPLVPYLMGESHPGGERLVSVQKCIRTDDIEEVGDSTHNTFFEMLGNWSLGDYFKKESIEWSWEFLTSKKGLGLNPKKIAVSVFAGDEDAPKDEDAAKIWLEVSKSELEGRIDYLPKAKNWWGPAGITGPCGPDTEIFYWVGDGQVPEKINQGDLAEHPHWVEIWNNVFMQYNKTAEGKYEPLKQKNVDTGMGLERTLAIINGGDDIYQTDLFRPIIEKIEKISGRKYEKKLKEFRIIADHLKASVFAINDGASPSNKLAGYIVRRLIRRAIVKAHQLGINENFSTKIAEKVFGIYDGVYEFNKENIIQELEKEENKFKNILTDKKIAKIKNEELEERYKILFKANALMSGMTKEKADKLLTEKILTESTPITASAFKLESSYGYPHDLFFNELFNKLDLGEEEKKCSGKILEDKYLNEDFKKHQELSRTASSGMFKGGLADAGEMTAKLHTATHLLLAALREVLGSHVFQKGSNITAERLRLDFAHNVKMTPEELEKAQNMVNDMIREDVLIACDEMSVDEAKKAGAVGVFEAKYGDKVKVYTIGPSTSSGSAFSREICGGPHAKSTGELGHFKIMKEEASSAGVRRIKAVLE
ncbi:MAG: alanine--tRNA ligase-related protein [Parcubacteria group bacterium]|jgi:alanyl-tRNA synthetase